MVLESTMYQPTLQTSYTYEKLLERVMYMHEIDAGTIPVIDTPTLQSSAMLLSIHISMYTGRKSDKKTREQVISASGAGSKAAASVYKSLFAGDADLDAINTFQAKARRDIAAMTLPWSDAGVRLVSTKNFFEVSALLSSLRHEFSALVSNFVTGYSIKVSNAAFALGDLFDRNEYPDPVDIAHKFSFSYSFEPVPSVNDFRVDLHNEAIDMLKTHYTNTTEQRLQTAMQDVWERVIDEATRLRDKMIVPEEGKRPRIFASTFSGFQDLIGSLEALNITNDPNLEDARVQLKNALDPVDLDSIRESPEVRGAVKEQMQRVLDKFAY